MSGVTFRTLHSCLLLLAALVLCSCAGSNVADLPRDVRHFRLGDQWTVSSKTFVGEAQVASGTIIATIVDTTFQGAPARAFRYVEEIGDAIITSFVVFEQAADGRVALIGEIESDGTEIRFDDEQGMPAQIGIGSEWSTEFVEGDTIAETHNRVEARESVTVGAGTFDSYRYALTVVGIPGSTGTGWLDPAIGFPLRTVVNVPTESGFIRVEEELTSYNLVP